MSIAADPCTHDPVEATLFSQKTDSIWPIDITVKKLGTRVQTHEKLSPSGILVNPTSQGHANSIQHVCKPSKAATQVHHTGQVNLDTTRDWIEEGRRLDTEMKRLGRSHLQTYTPNELSNW